MKSPGKVLISRKEIRKRVRELGEKISRDYQGKDLLLIGILKGAFVFLADLIREIRIPLQVDFLGVASYGSGTRPSEEVKVFKDLNQPVLGQNILIVEDIVDSGLTTDYLVRLLKARSPGSIRVCALLDKPDRRSVPIRIDYKGFTVPDGFVVGYGMDISGVYRNLPEIHLLEEDTGENFP